MNPALLEERFRDMVMGLTEAIDLEVAGRTREGLPIHISDNLKVVDARKTDSVSA